MYRYLDSMLPKYLLRSIGCGAPYGAIYSVNPAMIIALVPAVTAITAHVPHFDMIHYGSYISASSPFWIYLVPSPSVVGPLLFVVQLSLGEAVWSPRWCASTMFNIWTHWFHNVRTNLAYVCQKCCRSMPPDTATLRYSTGTQDISQGSEYIHVC